MHLKNDIKNICWTFDSFVFISNYKVFNLLFVYFHRFIVFIFFSANIFINILIQIAYMSLIINK